jgi:hypothetical protein
MWPHKTNCPAVTTAVTKFELLDVNTYEAKFPPSSEFTERRGDRTEILKRSLVILQ